MQVKTVIVSGRATKFVGLNAQWKGRAPCPKINENDVKIETEER